MRRVEWTESAIADVAAIREYLDANGSRRTQDMIDTVVLSTDWLLRNPGAGGSVRFRRWRKWRAEGTPYLIFYEPRRDGIAITRVLHARSDWHSLTE